MDAACGLELCVWYTVGAIAFDRGDRGDRVDRVWQRFLIVIGRPGALVSG